MRKKGGVRLTAQQLMEAWLFLRSINAEACPRCGGFPITASQDGRRAVYCDRCEQRGIVCGTCKMPVRFVLDDKGVVIETSCGCNG